MIPGKHFTRCDRSRWTGIIGHVHRNRHLGALLSFRGASVQSELAAFFASLRAQGTAVLVSNRSLGSAVRGLREKLKDQILHE